MDIQTLTNLVLSKANGHERFVVAVAGPPASGKSTLAERLRDEVATLQPQASPICVPMDGYHLDNEELKEMGLLGRKGAPNTFDAPSFIELVKDIRANKDELIIPEFDRTLDKVVEGTAKVSKENKIVIVEGNYILVEEAPWAALLPLFDLPVFLLPKTATLEERLIDRWLAHGHSPDAAKARAYSNDIPNAKYVLANSAYVDHTYEEIAL